MVKVNNKDTKTASMTLFWCIYCWLWSNFTLFFSVSTVDFEETHVCWESLQIKLHYYLHVEFLAQSKVFPTLSLYFPFFAKMNSQWRLNLDIKTNLSDRIYFKNDLAGGFLILHTFLILFYGTYFPLHTSFRDGSCSHNPSLPEKRWHNNFHSYKIKDKPSHLMHFRKLCQNIK